MMSQERPRTGPAVRRGMPAVIMVLGTLALMAIWGARYELQSGTVAQSDPSLAPDSSPVPQKAPAGMPGPAALGKPLSYEAVLESIAAIRVQMGERYTLADSDSLKARILAAARDSMIEAITRRIIPCWYGTAWGYHGTTQVPRRGRIACGYFVTTVLRDAGLGINRISLAQQASEVMIKTLVPRQHVRKYRYVSIDRFIAAIKDWGCGLYLVGLDKHTGFILNNGQDVYFIHSSPITSYSVVREKAAESQLLAMSHYRVLGKLSEADQLIEKWLKGERVTARDRSRKTS